MSEDDPTEHDGDMEHHLLSLGHALSNKSSLSQRVLDELGELDELNKLGAANKVSSRQPIVARSRWNPFGEMSMFQKISAASLAPSIALAATFWLALSAGSVSLEEVVENIRKATSYKADVRIKTLTNVDENMPTIVGKYYWRAPLDVRMETMMESGLSRIEIYFHDRAGVELDPTAKTYRIAAARAGASSPIMQLQNLSGLKDVVQRQLGEKSVHGTLCDGFEIKTSEVDSSAGDGMLTIWVNRETQLPVSVAMQISNQVPVVMVLDNIVWSVPLSDALFSTDSRGIRTQKTLEVEPTNGCGQACDDHQCTEEIR